jgi:gliding motility-associated-like protein
MADTSGLYWVEVSNETGCTGSDSILLEVVEVPPVNIGNDTTYCEVISLLLDAGDDYDQYLWQDGSDAQTFLVEAAGEYWVQVDLKGCSSGDTLIVVEDCPSLIWFPNGFSPNGDGKNDTYKAVYDNVETYNLLIFDRWGSLVFESNDIDIGWDGNIDGTPAPTGVYVFKAQYWDEQNAVNETITGMLTLLR